MGSLCAADTVGAAPHAVSPPLLRRAGRPVDLNVQLRCKREGRDVRMVLCITMYNVSVGEAWLAGGRSHACCLLAPHCHRIILMHVVLVGASVGAAWFCAALSFTVATRRWCNRRTRTS